MIIGYMVEIDWSQTDRDYVIVLGAKSISTMYPIIISKPHYLNEL